MDEHINKLTALGLTSGQARAYLIFLQFGPLSVINASERLGMSRQAANSVVSSLVGDGLLIKADVSGRKLYQASSPETLNQLAAKIAKDTLAEVSLLRTLESGNSLPGIITYENPLAMREWYLEFMRKAKTEEELLIWASGDQKAWYELDSDFYKKYIDFSAAKKIRTKVLLPNTNEAQEYQKKVGQINAVVRYIDGLPFQCEKWIWRDQVCFLSLDANSTSMMAITSKRISDLEKKTFELAWLGAQQTGKDPRRVI